MCGIKQLDKLNKWSEEFLFSLSLLWNFDFGSQVFSLLSDLTSTFSWDPAAKRGRLAIKWGPASQEKDSSQLTDHFYLLYVAERI